MVFDKQESEYENFKNDEEFSSQKWESDLDNFLEIVEFGDIWKKYECLTDDIDFDFEHN